jgi:hypothetical protein
VTDWTSGYVADIDYTYGYYGELNPLRVQLCFLHAGFAPPAIMTACELGFGQGVSLNIHAAATSVHWAGTDFNPSHAAHAARLAQVSGTDVTVSDEAFAEFCQRADLPEFDYIGVHGIWSWISDENRRIIVDFLRRKLRVGGILYVSYNTMPGWGNIVPLRHLMTRHAEVMGAPGQGIVSRINASIEFAEKLFAQCPAFSRNNPAVAERLKQMKDQSRNYLAHEYFNKDWLPMPFADMEQYLSEAKVAFACSAHYSDHIVGLNLTNEQQALLKDIPDPMFRETVRDFMVNQQFRRDYWVKGARRISTLEQVEGMRNVRVVLSTPRSAVTMKAKGSLGEATLQENIYAPLADYLAGYHTKSLGEIEQALKPKNITLAQLVGAIMVMAGKGEISIAQSDDQIAANAKRAQKFNQYVLSASRVSANLSFLASPVTGGGVPAVRFHQLFLLGRAKGAKTPEDWAKFAWDALVAQGQRVTKDGKAFETPEENIAELTAQAKDFAEQRLPLMTALKVA